MPATSCIAVMGFTPPLVKGGQMQVGIRTGGSLILMQGAVDVWFDLARAVRAHDSNPDQPVLSTERRQKALMRADRGLARKLISEEKRTAYVKVWRDLKTRKFPSLAAACRHHGQPYAAIHAWLFYNQDALPAMVAALPPSSDPILKPNGRIL